MDELAEIIKNVAASEGDEFKVYVLSGLNTDSGNYSSPAKIEVLTLKDALACHFM